MYVIALAYLDFFDEISAKLKKCTFFHNLRIITQKGNEKTTQISTFFHLLFLPYLLALPALSSFLNLKILKIHFQIHYFGPFWPVQCLNVSPKATNLDSSSYCFRKWLLKICYILSTRRNQIAIFLGSSSWTVLEIEENFIQNLSAFYCFFGDRK